MSSLNLVQIIGNLGREVEMRYLPDGTAVASLAIATSETWKDKQTGEKMEATEWHKVSLFGKLGEIAGQYLTKGSKVYISGNLKTRKYTDKDGVEKYSTEIRGNEMKMLSPRTAGQQQDDGYQEPTQQRQQTQQRAPATQQQQRPAAQQQRPASRPVSATFDDLDDEIPF